MDAIRIESATIEQILPLRHRILRTGLPLTAANLDGDTDPVTIHLAAWAGNCVVGCVSIMPRPYKNQPGWQVRGMAVDEGWQSRGIGRRLLGEAERRARQTRPDRLWCNARVPAIPFYQRQGWQVDSEPFDVPTAGPHVKMILQQADRPADHS